MKNSNITALIGALVFSVSVSKSYADFGIDGDTVGVSVQVPSTGFTYGPFVYTVGPADTIPLSLGTNLSLTVDNASLQFTFGPHGGAGGPYPPMGHFILFQDLSSSAPTITGLSYNTDLTGFVDSDISFTANSVTIGYGGIFWSGGQYLTVNLQLAPEPSVFALMGLGVILFMNLSNIVYRPNKALKPTPFGHRSSAITDNATNTARLSFFR